jgi:hypothetical protein
MLLPLTIAGFALLHARARFRGQSSFWLGGIYAAWLVFDAAKLALVGLVLVDSVMDFRRRWQPSVSGPDESAAGGGGSVSSDEGDEGDEGGNSGVSGESKEQNDEVRDDNEPEDKQDQPKQ